MVLYGKGDGDPGRQFDEGLPGSFKKMGWLLGGREPLPESGVI